MSSDKIKEIFTQLTVEHVVYSVDQHNDENKSQRILTERYRSADPVACVAFINREIINYTELTVLTVYS